MGVADHLSRVSKLRCRILTVDPSKELIEGITQDRQIRRIALFDLPSNFAWPREGEEWSIYEENGYWRLGNRFLSPEEREALRSVEPGQGLDQIKPKPIIPATPTAQDIADVLVELGLATQA